MRAFSAAPARRAVGLGVGDELLALRLRLGQRRSRLLLGVGHHRPRLLGGLGDGGVGGALRQQQGALHRLARIGVLASAQLLELRHHRAGARLGGGRLRLHGLDASRQLREEGRTSSGSYPFRTVRNWTPVIAFGLSSITTCVRRVATPSSDGIAVRRTCSRGSAD
jgi:hypothetical protein